MAPRHPLRALTLLSMLCLPLLPLACGKDPLPAAGVGGSASLAPYQGPCTLPGEVRACHVTLAQHGGATDCFEGTQTCVNGLWSPCDGNGGTIRTASLSPLSLSAPDAGAAACVADPCNPNCVGFDEKPPAPITSSCAPPSYAAAGMCSISSTYWSDNAIGCTAGSLDDCFFGDTCCAKVTAPACGYSSTSTNYCIARPTAGCGANPGCATAPDYTAAPACETADGHVHEMICNRGGVDAPTSGKLLLGLFDSSDFRKECGGCGPGAGQDKFAKIRGSCSLDLSVVSLKANTCVDLDMTAPGPGTSCTLKPGKNLNGAFGTYVNVAQKPAGTWAPTCSGAAGLAECNDCNNWSAMDFKDGKHPACPSTATPVGYNQTYTATCPPGYQVRWKYLGFKTTTPAGTDVKFAVQTGATTAGPWSPAAAVQVADAPVDHPSTCTTAGPSPCGGSYGASCQCPVDLFTPLGPANAKQPVLNLLVTLTGGCSVNPNKGDTEGDICGLPGGCDGPKARAQNEPCNGAGDCSYDTCCPAAGGTCAAWPNAPKTFACAACTGVDYTVAVGCKDAGRQRFSVCNRGTADSPGTGTLKLGFNQGNPGYPQVIPFSVDKGECTIDLSVVGPIKSGGCADIFLDGSTPGVDCSGASITGNRFVVIDDDGALADCNPGNNTSFNNGGLCTSYNAPPGGQAQLDGFQVTYDCVPNE